MNNNSSKSYDAEDPIVLQPTKAALCGDIDGIGKFLFQMHSVHYAPPLFAKEETSLQFYEHVVVAVITTTLWCFPKTSKTFVIPRFKIIDASFTFGPRRVPLLVYFLMLIAIILIGIGSVSGGCRAENYTPPALSSSYSSIYSYDYNVSNITNSSSSPAACSSLVIGCLMLIPGLLLLFLPFCFKKHHVYLDVKTSLRSGIFGRSITYDFPFKKIGFEHATYNNAAFNEIHLVNYVFGTLGDHGKEALSRYHLLSHFHQVDLANPIAPVHADDSLRDIVATTIAGRSATSAIVDSVHSRAADIPLVGQHANGHYCKRQQISVSV